MDTEMEVMKFYDDQYFEKLGFKRHIGLSVKWMFPKPRYTHRWHTCKDFLIGIEMTPNSTTSYWYRHVLIIYRPDSPNYTILAAKNFPKDFDLLLEALVDTSKMPLCLGLPWAAPFVEGYYKSV